MAKLIYRVSFTDSNGSRHVFERDTANAALAIRRLYEGVGLSCHFECVRVRPVGLPQW